MKKDAITNSLNVTNMARRHPLYAPTRLIITRGRVRVLGNRFQLYEAT